MKNIILFVASIFILSNCINKNKEYDAEGSFESVEITVSAEATGKILDLDITEGQKIDSGQKVGSIDSTQLYLTKLQLEKSVESVKSKSPDIKKQILVLEEEINKQKAERERVKKLLKDGAATTKQLDDITAQITILERQLEAQKSTLRKSQLSIDAQSSSMDMQIAQVEDKLAKCMIISPVSGTVLVKYTNVGEFANIGKPLFKVADLDNIFLRVYINSGQLSNIKLGQEVKVFADFGGDKIHEYQGVIKWISSKSEFTPKNIQTKKERENLVYAIKIAVKNDGYIKLGMYGGVKF